jgi:adenine-specific DNA-methyltransferase
MTFTKENLGQFFTPPHIVTEMVNLIENNGVIIEPSCGPGAFLEQLPQCTIGIELDPSLAHPNAIIMDFFDCTVQADTIIGNPPYVRYQDIHPVTHPKLPNGFDNRSNLYLFFIEHSMNLLKDNGELIFIVPRDFIKTTSALQLNERLFNNGGFTYWHEFGDEKVFADASPNVAIFRWVKGGTHTIPVTIHNGYLTFGEEITEKKKVYLNTLFDILVGGASGANGVFIEETGNIDLVVSDTKRTGQTKKAHYATAPTDYLQEHKTTLLARRIKTFNESNWWEWGRKIRYIDGPKIYVNNKTRDMQPFFTNESGWFDGSVLALVPKDPNAHKIEDLIDILNNTDWNSQGFLVGGRLIFGQRSLSNAYILI